VAEEADGIDEALEGQLRVLVTAAGQVGERLARSREEALRREQTRNEQEHRELRSRLEAERHAARAELTGVHRADWWDRATPEQIGRAYQVARTWADEEPEAVRAEQKVREEVKARYGIDVTDTGADSEAVRQRVQLELDRADAARAAADAERSRAAAESAEAHRLLALSGREDTRGEQARAAAEFEPDPAERERAAAEAASYESGSEWARDVGLIEYDSAERREGTARELEAAGLDRELVATKMRADVSQAKPATEAVTTTRTGRAAKARTTGVRTARAQRAGLDR
jgi:hypothetical protein